MERGRPPRHPCPRGSSAEHGFCHRCVVTVAGGRFAAGHVGELTGSCRSRWSTRRLPRPAGCSRGCGICPRGWWCICCSPPGCSPSSAIGRYGRACSRTGRGRLARVGSQRVGVVPGPASGRVGTVCGRCSTCSADRPPARRRPGVVAWAGWCARSTAPRCVCPTARRTCRFTGAAGLITAAPATRCCGWPHWSACGTRTVIDAVFGSDRHSEPVWHRPATAMRPGMIVLADRNYGYAPMITALAATGAHLLIRVRNNTRPRDRHSMTARCCPASAHCRYG